MKQNLILLIIIYTLYITAVQSSTLNSEKTRRKRFNRELSYKNYSFETRYAALYTVVQKAFGSNRFPRFIFHNIKNKCEMEGKYKNLKLKLIKTIKEFDKINEDRKANMKMTNKFHQMESQVITGNKNKKIVPKKKFLTFSFREHRAIRNLFLTLFRTFKNCRKGMRRMRKGIELVLFDFDTVKSHKRKGKLYIKKAIRFIRELYMIIVKHKVFKFGKYRSYSLKSKNYLGNSKILIDAAGKLIGNFLKYEVHRLLKKYKKKKGKRGF